MKLTYIFLAYLIGAIPFSLILGLIFVKKDLRLEGSGNVGSTNAARVLGYKIGAITLILDISKGLVPTFIASYYYDISFAILIGLFTVIGHVFPVYLKFKGGKAVATSLGVFIVIFSKGVLVALILFILVYILTRYVALASISAAISMPITAYFMANNMNVFYLSLLIALIIVVRHKSNIINLINNKEDKFV